VARQIRNWRFVKTGSSVDVDSVDDILGLLRTVGAGWMRGLVLAGRCEKQTAVWSKGQAPEERCKSFIGVDVAVSCAKTHVA